MNIALSTFILFIFLIPGLFFRRLYFSAEFSKQYVKQNYLEQFIASFIPSLLFHVIWFYLIQIFDYQVNFKVLGYIFSSGKMDEVFNNFNHYTIEIITYHFTIFLFSAFIGFLSKLVVRNFKWDRKRKIFRYKNSWHYLFKGEFFDFKSAAFDLEEDTVEEIEFFYIDVLTEFSDTTVLYEGILVDYELSHDGGLNYLILKEAERRFVKESGNNSGISSAPYPLPGHIILIPYSSIININFSFYKLIEPEVKDEDYDFEVVLIK